MAPKKMSKVQGPEPKSEGAPKPSEDPKKSRQPTNTGDAEPKKEVKKDDHASADNDDESASVNDSEGDGSGADSDAESWSPDSGRQKTPPPASAPCACSCGKCCCHSTSSEPQHCVRCHTDYTFNHSQACSVPHVFCSDDKWNSDEYPLDYIVRSMCCGSEVAGIETAKSYWSQAAPCFMGWHTTDVDTVKGMYNGTNVLRCDVGAHGKCRRTPMKHHAHYEHLYDDKVKYVKEDVQDQEEHLKRKRDALGEDDFDEQFSHVDDPDDMSEAKKRAKLVED